ncbi:unnamed protein product [Linum trigynum]|uniref:Uncharacterized protein n=1 Tax=Linum trigynum TaxID=586398 RepID=A0AAV2DY29_9ROSI
MNIKIQTNSSDKAFNQYLELINEGLPNGETLPTSFYEVKKYMRDLGFGYTIIDACPNNCVLYRGQLEAARECPKCKEPRFKSGKQKDVALKRARYSPIMDRLQQLFTTKDLAKDMRWHKDKRVDDDMLRHPTDGKT